MRELMVRHYEMMRQPELIPVSQWAEQTRKLSREASAQTGLFKCRPFQSGILDALSPDSPWQTVVLMLSSQSFKTEAILNFLGYIIDRDPGPVLLVEPREIDAKALSKDRVAPMIRDTPELRCKVGRMGGKNGNTTLHKTFRFGHMSFAGANSPSGLAMRPVRYLMLDEVDRYPVSAGREGDPCMLAIRRTDEFTHNKKILMCSTPTIEGQSRIYTAYKESDQRRPLVPCPECGEFQELRFENLKWEKNNPDSVEYECASCHVRIPHWRKGWMLSEGKWVTTNPQSKIAGFWLNQLYSVRRSWADVVSEFLLAEQSSETLRVFVNTVLAEVWREKGEVPDWRRLYERAEPYSLGIVPAGGLLLTAGVDVQEDRLEIQVVAWGRRMESWLVDYKVIEGSVRLASAYRDAEGEKVESVWTRLEQYLNSTFKHELTGAEMPIQKAGVDSGYATQEVYDWSRRCGLPQVMLVRGYDRGEAVARKPIYVDVSYRGTNVKNGAKMWPVNVSMMKDALYGLLRLDKPTRESGDPYPAGFCHFPQMNEEFFKQLCAEQLESSVNRSGYRVRKWTKHGRNESLDTRIYARAAAYHLGLDRFPEKRWFELEHSVGLETPEDKKATFFNPVVPQTPTAQKPLLRPQRAKTRVVPPSWHSGGSPWG